MFFIYHIEPMSIFTKSYELIISYIAYAKVLDPLHICVCGTEWQRHACRYRFRYEQLPQYVLLKWWKGWRHFYQTDLQVLWVKCLKHPEIAEVFYNHESGHVTGNCDDGCLALAQELGWHDELHQMQAGDLVVFGHGVILIYADSASAWFFFNQCVFCLV